MSAGNKKNKNPFIKSNRGLREKEKGESFYFKKR